MPNGLDVALVAVFAAVWPLLEYFWRWPAHVRAVDAGDPRARSRAYVSTLVMEWLLAAAVLALALAFRRPAAWFGLTMPGGWRLALGFGLPLVYAVLVTLQGRTLSARPKSLARLRVKLQPLRALIPHTPGELRLFAPLCFTAGFCEELLYRGYLVWALRPAIGLYPAAAVSMVMFGLAHSYQGARFGLRAFYAGVAMGVLALVTRSVVPGMVLHALVDLAGGWITYQAMNAPPLEVVPEPASGAA